MAETNPKSPTSNVKILRRLSNIRKSINRKKLFNRSQRRSSSLEEEKFEIKDTEIPPKACSVLQIKDYIENDMVKEAYLNLLSLRLELKQEQEALGDKASTGDLRDNKKTDIKMLFENLMVKMADIVVSCKKELLVYVATIILEEEKRQGEPGVMEGWREAWKDAVQNGVRNTLKKVHLDGPEQNTSWLVVHLGLLGKAIVEDLERVEAELLRLYPPDFNVFKTYVSCHHKAVQEHVKELQKKVTEQKDYHDLLDFIIHLYPSEKIMGHFTVLSKEERTLKLEEDFLNTVKDSYCKRLREDFRAALVNIIKTEREDVWKMKKTPDRTDDRFLVSKIHTNICQMISSYADDLGKFDDDLGKSAVRFFLEELNPFLGRFEEEFSQHTRFLLTSDLLDISLWVEYHIAYINSFNSLKEDVQCYKESCSAQVKQVGKEVDGFIQRLCHTLMEHFKADIKAHMNVMMTKTWLQTDEDFKEVIFRIESFSGHCKSMKDPSAQCFANDVHYHVAKEYVSQMMKKKYSCKNTKKEDASEKIREQWGEFKKLFEDMGSTLQWLYPLGFYLSDIIGMENEKNIKDKLDALVSNYPDISKKQISAILHFRDNGFSLERHQVINHFTLLKRDAASTNHERAFFTDIK